MTTLPPEGEGAPNQPQQPGGQQPPQQPPAAPPGQTPPPQQPSYGAPQQVPPADPASNLTLNYWLSVFFLWIPALIFYIIEKDKGNPQVRALHAANLNFALLRTALGVVGWIFALIPVIGPLVLLIAHLVLFVFHIIAATKVIETYRRGGGDPFIFNVPLIK
ncbi:DUF4870 domain-containing protein [Leucobacter denitrificans]|uniref:DUF4870 domain-containing protein n=1 Tax=Leucobacter denitrificans TaxID=683042 RepID=A0A7G9S3B5_9MICO|nr:DUF4870 domain-containing protein [Leucobacter denitrificans]QNN62340.1 DUF4870 domain-containing protein [Leucobacter denitrificans]